MRVTHHSLTFPRHCFKNIQKLLTNSSFNCNELEGKGSSPAQTGRSKSFPRFQLQPLIPAAQSGAGSLLALITRCWAWKSGRGGCVCLAHQGRSVPVSSIHAQPLKLKGHIWCLAELKRDLGFGVFFIAGVERKEQENKATGFYSSDATQEA